MRRLNSGCLAICLLAGSLLTQADASEPEQRLQARLAGIDSLHAQFIQQGQTPQTGEFWLQKPGRFRFESAAPLSQTIVSDGQTLWTHDRDLAQVIIADLADREHEIPLLLFSRDPEKLLAQYAVEAFQDEQFEYFLLRSVSSDSPVTAITLRFDQEIPVGIRIASAMSDQTVVSLQAVTLNEAHEAAIYTFEVPEGIDVIDDRVQDN